MTNKISTLESKFVGVWLSRQTDSFLSLYALSKGISKSKVIREELEEWVLKNTRNSPVEHLLKLLIDKYQTEWKDKKRLYHITDPNRFTIHKEDLYILLERKGLSEAHITRILEGIVE